MPPYISQIASSIPISSAQATLLELFSILISVCITRCSGYHQFSRLNMATVVNPANESTTGTSQNPMEDLSGVDTSAYDNPYDALISKANETDVCVLGSSHSCLWPHCDFICLQRVWMITWTHKHALTLCSPRTNNVPESPSIHTRGI